MHYTPPKAEKDSAYIKTVSDLESCGVISLGEAASRLRDFIHRYDNINCTEHRLRKEKDFLGYLTSLSEVQLGNAYQEEFVRGHASCGDIARIGYNPESSVEHRLTLVLNAFDVTFRKEPRVVTVRQEKGLKKLFSSNRDETTNAVIDFFEEEDMFFDMIGEQKLDGFQEQMSLFAGALPKAKAKQPKSLAVFTLHHEESPTKVEKAIALVRNIILKQ